MYGYVKIFYFGGALNFFYFLFILCVSGSGTLVLRNFFFGMEIFGHVGFGHGN